MTLATIILLALLAGLATWRFLLLRQTQDEGTERLDLTGRRLGSAQRICEQAAAKLKLNIVFVESTACGVRSTAGAPWLVDFEILDEIAIRASLSTGQATGLGAGRHSASDWLFVPIKRGGIPVAVAGVAGPFCRRRLTPGQPEIRSLRRAFERFVAIDSAADLPVAEAPSPDCQDGVVKNSQEPVRAP